MSDIESEVQMLQSMLSQERLGIDVCDGRRTTFLTHIGAAERLVPGAWIARRELLLSLALTNLSPRLRSSLARAILVDDAREFGVGHLRLRALPSGLPLGGASLWLQARDGELSCLHTWALGFAAEPRPCTWLALRAEPSWALDAPPRTLAVHGLRTLIELGGKVVVAVDGAVAACQVASAVGSAMAMAAHPRLSPHIDNLGADAGLTLWPHDAIGSSSFSAKQITTTVLVAAPERVDQGATRWAQSRRDSETAEAVEIVHAGCPGRIDREALATFWRRCERPKILLRGEPTWVGEGEVWLRSIGATVERHNRGTQLPLF